MDRIATPALFILTIATVIAVPPASPGAQESEADSAPPDDDGGSGKPALPRVHNQPDEEADAGARDAADTGTPDAAVDDAGAAPEIPKFLTENAIVIGDTEYFPDLALRYTPLDEKLRLGIDRFRDEQYDEAIKLIADYLSNRPNSTLEPEARFALGMALLVTGEPGIAEKILGKGDAPRYLEDYRQYYTAEAAFKTGDYAAAQRLFQEIVLKFPGSSLARAAEMRAADAMYAAGNTREAFSAYKAYVYGSKPHERLDTIYFNMARCAWENDDFEQAAVNALKIWYKYPESHLAGQALEILDAVRRVRPKLGGATFKQRYIRTLKLARHNFLDKAVSELSALYEAIPDTRANRPLLQKVYFKLGQIFVQQKEHDMAREVFATIRENDLFGNDYKAKGLFELANLEKRVENNRKAIDLYLEFVGTYKKSPDADNALYFAAWLHYSMKEYEDATKLFERQIREYPRSDVRDEALWFLAWTHFKNGKTKKAQQLLKTLVKDVPDSQSAPRAAYFAAKFAQRLKQDADARAGFEAVVAEYPLTYYSFLAQHALKERYDTDVEMPDRASAKARIEPSDAGRADPPKTQAPAAPASGADQPQDPDEADDGMPAETKAARDAKAAAGTAHPTADAGAQTAPEVTPSDANGQAIIDRFVAASRDMLSMNKAAALMRLGLPDAAANELARLKENAGNDPAGHYAAATLHALTGDHYRAIVTLRSIFIAQMLRRFSSAEKKYWRRMFPLAYRPQVEQAAAAHRLDPLLVLAIMREESNFRPKVVSPVGARGLMQIMPRTGKLIAQRKKIDEFDADELFTPATNITFGSWYLRELVVKFNGQVPLSVSGYNAGPGAVERWLRNKGNLDLDEFIEEIPYKETRNYCKRVLQTYGIYRFLYTASRTPLPLFTRLNQQFNDNLDF